MRRRRNLRAVRNPAGRLDVLAYRMAERVVDAFERERGIPGLNRRLMPLLESIISENVPRNLPSDCEYIANLVARNWRMIPRAY